MATRDNVTLAGGKSSLYRLKKNSSQTLDRLSPEKLLTVLHFTKRIVQQVTEQVAPSTDVSTGEVEHAVADFLAAAGCGHSGDAKSSLRIDEVLYGRQGLP
jgi:hypothetical protein